MASHQGVMPGVEITYPVALRVDIGTEHIDGGIARVPVLGDRVPHPDQVVDAVVVRQALVDDIPELLGVFGALGTPPEPPALGLVEGPEEDGHAGVLEALELDGDGVNVADQEGVIGVCRVGQGRGDVEVGGVGVEAAVPGPLGRVVQADGGVPVPAKGDDAALFVKSNGLLDSLRVVALELDARGRVVHEVEAEHGGRLADLLLDPVGPLDLLLAREDLLAVVFAEEVVQGRGAGVGVGVDGALVDVVRRAGGRGRDGDGVDEVPVPSD